MLEKTMFRRAEREEVHTINAERENTQRRQAGAPPRRHSRHPAQLKGAPESLSATAEDPGGFEVTGPRRSTSQISGANTPTHQFKQPALDSHHLTQSSILLPAFRLTQLQSTALVV